MTNAATEIYYVWAAYAAAVMIERQRAAVGPIGVAPLTAIALA